MKQYKITSADFRLEGEDSSLPSCYVDPAQLAQVKALAGIDQLGIMARHVASQQRSAEQPVELQRIDVTPRPVTLMSKNSTKPL